MLAGCTYLVATLPPFASLLLAFHEAMTSIAELTPQGTQHAITLPSTPPPPPSSFPRSLPAHFTPMLENCVCLVPFSQFKGGLQ